MAVVLLEAGIVFAVLAVGAAVAGRIRQSVIPAYIVAGILVGPNAPTVGGVSLAMVESREFVTLLSELGVVFLLFFIGLEFNLDRLAASKQAITRAGVVDLVVNFSVGLGLGLLVGFSLFESLFVAGIVYISSSAIITKTLIDLGWIADPESEAILGVLVFEDVAIAVYLALLTAVAVGGGSPGEMASSLGVSFALLVSLVALAAVGTPALERLYDVRSDERFLVQVVGAVVLVSGVALSLGVSEAVAAFFLGSAFAGTSHAERVERVITSERDLYAAVFFFSIGLATDPSLFGGVAVPLAVLVVGTTATKLATGFYAGRTYGLSDRRALRVGFALVSRGEFSLVIAALAVSAGTTPNLRETIPALAVGYVLVMGLLGTTLMRHTERVEALLERPPAGRESGG